MLERFKPSSSQEQIYRGANQRLGRTLAISAFGNASFAAGVAAVASGRIIEGIVAGAAGATILGHEHIVNNRNGK